MAAIQGSHCADFAQGVSSIIKAWQEARKLIKWCVLAGLASIFPFRRFSSLSVSTELLLSPAVDCTKRLTLAFWCWRPQAWQNRQRRQHQFSNCSWRGRSDSPKQKRWNGSQHTWQNTNWRENKSLEGSRNKNEGTRNLIKKLKTNLFKT